jgi:hypothetical protein
MTDSGVLMRDDSEDWKTICEQAAVEQDPEKLIKLTRRITELLDGRNVEARDLAASRTSGQSAPRDPKPDDERSP